MSIAHSVVCRMRYWALDIWCMALEQFLSCPTIDYLQKYTYNIELTDNILNFWSNMTHDAHSRHIFSHFVMELNQVGKNVVTGEAYCSKAVCQSYCHPKCFEKNLTMFCSPISPGCWTRTSCWRC